jgi:DNA-directed RNA polymerase specialized sigma24 family protein
MEKNEDNHYVDNKRLYAEMIKYINQYNEAKEKGLELPRANDYIGKCIWLIANRLSTNRNFIGYTYREDMIGDAIENCFRYLHNFDPEKSNNPFAYFTQIMYYAFLRRIDKEKKQSYIKYKTMENSLAMNTLVEMAPDDQSHFNAFITTMDMDKLSALSEKYETKTTSKASKKKGLEKFFGDENESI